VIDASVPVSIDPASDYDLKVSLKGTTVSVELGGRALLGHVFNAVVVDRRFGVLTRDGINSFESVTFRSCALARTGSWIPQPANLCSRRFVTTTSPRSESP
jgi:hypothetical protein